MMTVDVSEQFVPKQSVDVQRKNAARQHSPWPGSGPFGAQDDRYPSTENFTEFTMKHFR